MCRSSVYVRFFFFFNPRRRSADEDVNGSAARRLPYMASRAPDLPRLRCNPSLLFNKQFVSDVLNAGSNLIVREMSLEVAVCSPSPLPRLTFSSHLAVCGSHGDILTPPHCPAAPPSRCVLACVRLVSVQSPG